MPANVESMFSVRQMPWHREGTITQDYPGSWAEARHLAGLDWEPVPADIYLARWHTGNNPVYEPVEGWQAICRSDTGTVLQAIHGTGYQPQDCPVCEPARRVG